MTVNAAAERRFLNQDEQELIGSTHYPQLAELDSSALRERRARLRDLRDKATTVARHKRREARGKAAARAKAASGSSEHAARRKQVFSQALQRTSRQLTRLEHAEAAARTTAGAKRALALRRRAEAAERLGARPPNGRTARSGMRSNPSLRRAMEVNPAMVGEVSKRGKVAQARRDSAGKA